MEHAGTRVEWPAAISLHVDLDVLDPDGYQLRGSGLGVVQLLVGSSVRVRVWQPDATEPVLALPGSIVPSVIAVEVFAASLAAPSSHGPSPHASSSHVPEATPVALEAAETDDTILSPAGVRAASERPPAAAHTRVENDVADTILGRAGGDDAAADTIIGVPGPRPRAQAAGGVAARHAVRFPDGRVVPLDRIVYVGRSPRSPRITSGTVPELVAVPSPLREISGTHLEIEVQGGVVVVRDLGSTNGTHVSLPGALRSLLSPGDSRVVPIGTLLDLGDSTVLEIVPGTAGGASW
ncbi:FHA domain-containing protein [Agreia sp. COWG]|uniref:FHA domain-containing protein n=1 Tax=Agreia sp. COWG TaxID=2773266 RepID=UPI001925FD9E|nr:FHA domain-containing protein [Agreia sp. COWG]CAD6004768.1 FHA domain-containing protein [Agreia sp. COWG]